MSALKDVAIRVERQNWVGSCRSAFPLDPLRSGRAAYGHFQPIAERLLSSDPLPKPEQLQSTLSGPPAADRPLPIRGRP